MARKSEKVRIREMINDHLSSRHGYRKMKTLELAMQRHRALHEHTECDHTHHFLQD